MAGACVAGLELPEGDPGAVEEAAAAMHRCAGGFEGAGGTAAAAAGSVPSWNGLASFTFRASCGDYRSAAHAAEAVCGQAAHALARYARELEDGRNRVRRLQHEGDLCMERIHKAERAARSASERELAAQRLAHQASFLAGADGGGLRSAALHDASLARDDYDRAQREIGEQQRELERLRRQAHDVREHVRDAGRRAAAEVSSMAVDLPTVSYPGAPVTPIAASGARPNTDGGALNTAKSVAADLSGVTDAKDSFNDFADGNLIGGALHLALALPVGKLPKLGEEVGKVAVERVVKEEAEDAGERVARDTVPAFKGTPGERLPRYDGGKTEGVIEVDGQRYHVQSGYGKPSSELPRGVPGFNGNVKAHVEGQVAALMRQRNLKRLELWINQNPCGGARGCNAMLPRMLPEGSELVVHGPDGAIKVYKGIADR